MEEGSFVRFSIIWNQTHRRGQPKHRKQVSPLASGFCRTRGFSAAKYPDWQKVRQAKPGTERFPGFVIFYAIADR